MQPEFLIIPILAYGIFVFRSEVKNNKFRFESISKNLLFFVPLAIIGAFLAKGTQEPFGIIYRWLFLYFPGFVLFRDPSKFYLLIALSYSVLIPYFIFIVLQYRNSRYKILGSILFIVYWAFVIKDIVIVGSGISVRPRVVPEEYTQVHKFISNESDFSRTFWITDYHRFGENTLTHPAVSAFGYLDTRDANVVIKFLQSPIAETRLRRIGIKYIVIPNDSEFEIFLTRRLYDDGLREKIIDTVRKIPWAVELPPIGNIKIFRMGGSSKRFFYDFPDRMVNLTYNMHSSTHYSVHISNELPVNKIIFSENYDRHWVLKSGRTIIHPQKTSDNLMVFEVDNNMRKVDIYYEPQNGVKTGSAVSLVSLVSVSIVLLSYSGMPHKFKSKKTISKSIN